MFTDFEKQIDNRYYKHLHIKSFMPLSKIKDRKAFLLKLKNQLNSKEYHPHTPRGYIVQGKDHLISRIIPILNTEDACIYYYCIKKIEDCLAKTRVTNTYGGFSMGGPIRKSEENDFAAVAELESSSVYPYNPFAWTKEWGDFQEKAYTYAAKSSYSYYIKFDIANFYDTLNLNYLETKIRSVCGGELIHIIDLLIYFLKHWNRDFENFKQKNIGIPQDEVGDCSRVLANFYLHEYDSYINSIAESLNCKWLRYSDDQIIYAHDEYSAKKLLYLASNYLAKINLNINPKKIECFSQQEDFFSYWSFDIYQYLAPPYTKFNIEAAIKILLSRSSSNKPFRRESALKRIINVLSKSQIKIDKALKTYLEGQITKDDFILTCGRYELNNIYRLVNPTLKKELASKLNSLAKTYFFNQFHYSLLKCNIRAVDKVSVKKLITTYK